MKIVHPILSVDLWCTPCRDARVGIEENSDDGRPPWIGPSRKVKIAIFTKDCGWLEKTYVDLDWVIQISNQIYNIY